MCARRARNIMNSAWVLQTTLHPLVFLTYLFRKWFLICIGPSFVLSREILLATRACFSLLLRLHGGHHACHESYVVVHFL